MSQRTSSSSVDTIAAEALDVFEEQSISSSSSKSTKAFLGRSPYSRRVQDLKQSPSRRDSPTLPWRRASIDSMRQRTVAPPTRARGASTSQVNRSSSPDIEDILKRTPRPRRSSSSLHSSPAIKGRSRSYSSLSSRSPIKNGKMPAGDNESILKDGFETLLEQLENDSDSDGGGSETDSSIDIHTPLPHLMFRDGVLSPRSKLLPQDLAIPYVDTGIDRSQSVLSLLSNAGSIMTKSGLQKDPRDTERRRIRHRDGRLLRAGMGLTTGLGWSDSEDEDAPSALTRRLIHTTIERKKSSYSVTSSRPTSEILSSDFSLSRLATPVSKPSLSRKAGQSDLRSEASSPSLRSTSVAFPTTDSKTARPMPSLDSLLSRNRSDSIDSLSSYSQASIPRSRVASTGSVADSLASRGDPDALNVLTKASSAGSKLSSIQENQSPDPLSATSLDGAHSSPKLTAAPVRNRASSVTTQHPQGDRSLLKLRTVVKKGTVIPPPTDSTTPEPDAPPTPTALQPTFKTETSVPVNVAITSRDRADSASTGSGLPKPRVMASPAKRVEVVTQTSSVGPSSANHVLNSITGYSYTSVSISSLTNRSRAESSASVTTSSSHSTDPPKAGQLGSLVSTSTSSLTSTEESFYTSRESSESVSSSSLPRPLRLPQTAGRGPTSRPFPQDPYMSSSSSIASNSNPTGSTEQPQRKRALSGPRPLRPSAQSQSPLAASKQSSPAYPLIGTVTKSTSAYALPVTASIPASLISSTSPTGSSPMTSPLSSPGSPRQRPIPTGGRNPRPKPRTGTGMAYRSSSFGNLQDASVNMRNMIPNSVLDRATASTSNSAQPVRI